MKFFLAFVFLIAILSLFVASWPIVLVLVIFLAFDRKTWIFFLAFFGGIILDLMLFRLLGATSVFLATFIFLIFLYEKKFEIYTLPFVLTVSFIGSALYLVIFGYNYVFQQALASSLIAVLLFALAKNLQQKKV
ncbi:MAG: hypothetical protein Q7R31_03825 [Candidatus Levybacteria bacterium]|nr:hypothetical protein [Candidatus Levybacteria bacterium]